MKDSKSIWMWGCGCALIAWLALGFVVAVVIYEVEAGKSTADRMVDFQVRFGILKERKDGTSYLAEETSTIPFQLQDTGFRYGFVIEPPDDRTYTVRCVIHFSAPPKMVSGDLLGSDQISDTMKSPPETVSGENVDEFGFDPGDPLGEQSIEVYVDDRLIKTIKFTVIPAS